MITDCTYPKIVVSTSTSDKNRFYVHSVTREYATCHIECVAQKYLKDRFLEPLSSAYVFVYNSIFLFVSLMRLGNNYCVWCMYFMCFRCALMPRHYVAVLVFMCKYLK